MVEQQKFIAKVKDFYKHHERHLSWRTTTNPYHILVSEFMLQQTQVDRVVPFYEKFLQTFPTIMSLAEAQQADVLIAWQGLGYNRRARYLHQSAQIVAEKFQGNVPLKVEELLELPGIGLYTACAIATFSYNVPLVFIETNIRTVYLFEFFQQRLQSLGLISDNELLPLIKQTLDYENPRQWYYALMDYGSYLKKTVGNINIFSKHYSKQSAFQGSDRQIRGAIIRALTVKSTCFKDDLYALVALDCQASYDRFINQLQRLHAERFVLYINDTIKLL